jgi:hypothetical protein
VLMHVDRVQPGQQRFAQLMEQLAMLSAALASDGEPVAVAVSVTPG